MEKIKWENSVWFFDLDDTLIDTVRANTHASQGIFEVFASNFDDVTALKVQRRYQELYDTLLFGYRVRHDSEWEQVPGQRKLFDGLLEKIESSQRIIQSEHGHAKKWSREALIKIVVDEMGLTVPSELIHEAADAYWVSLSKQVEIFSDAHALLGMIKEQSRPVYIVTSSDARLTLQPDGQFAYNPQYSESLKRQRIELLRDRGLVFNLISIGDPEDKPHVEFFEKGIKLAEQELEISIERANCIVVGDSYSGDLETPHKKMGFGLAVLVKRDQPETVEPEPGYVVTNDLLKVTDYLI